MNVGKDTTEFIDEDWLPIKSRHLQSKKPVQNDAVESQPDWGNSDDERIYDNCNEEASETSPAVLTPVTAVDIDDMWAVVGPEGSDSELTSRT